LIDQIGAVHEASRQTYGSPRVRAELVLGQGVVVSRKTVAVAWKQECTTQFPCPAGVNPARGYGEQTDPE
jgi:hypothetical protein